MKAARSLQDETKATIERMTLVVGASEDVMVKTKLFDEEVHKDQKLSGIRIACILADFAREMEDTMKEFRDAAKKIDEGSRKIQSDPISLSRISIPDEFDDVEILEGKFETPVSKAKASMIGAPTAKTWKKLPMEPERIPERRERNKSISEVSTHEIPNRGCPP